MNAVEFKNHIKNNLLPFWNRLRDDENGGFYGSVDSDGTICADSIKGVILNSRILWFYSKAYQVFKEKKLLEMADHAYRFLIDCCFDSQYGGVYWSLNSDGTICDSTKHTYNQAFAIYALSAYYEASGRREALNMAYVLYRVIEEKCRDKYGYLEAFERDFTPASNEKLSENGVIAYRTMNTLLHVLEAYTELYNADHFDEVGESLRFILDLFKDKIYNSDKQICEVFFDRNYHPLINLESYGHDIETAWLIDRCIDVLGDEKYTREMSTITEGLAQAAYDHAYDQEQHGLNNERENDKIDTDKIWWVQAESVVGFYNAYQKNPSEDRYLQAASSIWKFIQEKAVDKKTGEWIECVPADGEPRLGQALVHPWKCPYHNGRMCMEMLERMQKAS
ncbi:MAG: AGE family epimerase/isomerase [Wujia sp.]